MGVRAHLLVRLEHAVGLLARLHRARFYLFHRLDVPLKLRGERAARRGDIRDDQVREQFAGQVRVEGDRHGHFSSPV